MGQRKRVLLMHFNRKPPVTGGEYVYCKIGEALSSEYDVDEISINMLILRYFKKKGLARAFARYLLEPTSILYPLLMRKKYDLIFTSWSDHVPFFGDVVYAQPLAGKFSMDKTAFCINDHGNLLANAAEYLGTGLTWHWRRLFGKFSLKHHYFISNSRSTADYVFRAYHKRSWVIYPPTELEPFVYAPSNKERMVLSVGNVVPQKRFDLIGKIGTRMPDVKFVLIGKAEGVGEKIVKSIKEAFEKQGLANNFVFLGYVSERDKAECLKKASVIFHPAINEPFGIALVEGMASGAVPVAHNSGGPSEFIDSKWLFSNDEEMVEKIRQALAADIKTRQAIREKSLAFNETQFKRNLLQVCSKIMSSKGS